MERKNVKISNELLEIQKEYINKVSEINNKSDKKPKFLISTFGCQMNVHDSEKLRGMLFAMGYEQANEETEADIVVYNTCCVRENAEKKVYGKLGYLKHIKEDNKGFKIVLCGCMMQQNTVIEKIRKSYRYVDIIFGTYNLYRFPELLHSSIETNSQVVDIWDEHGEIVEDLPSRRESLAKAGVNIMYGCDNFCTYCIVPYVRGRERSRTPEDIVSEIKRLAAEGVVEITLLGQNVNSYGKGMDADVDFPKLLRIISEIEGIKRIRFMTSHPKDLSEGLIDAIADLPKVCKHLHLPFQSGSTEILTKMNRRYTKEQYLELMNKIRNKVPEISVTTDIIVGFPSETEEDFSDTLELVKKVRFNLAFMFIYSARTGTPAAVMDCKIPDVVVGERFKRLLDVMNPIIYENNKSYEGKVLTVLADNYDEAKGVVTGRSDDFSIVHFRGGKHHLGKFVEVSITEGKPFYLMGEAVSERTTSAQM